MKDNRLQVTEPRDAGELLPELDLLDRENPNSLVNMLPGSMEKALTALPPELLMLGDKTLEKKGNIGVTEKRLRHSFWLEYNAAFYSKRKINMANIYNGVCRKEQWWHQVITDAYKLAYIVTPPPDYRVEQSELLSQALEQMRSILETPHVRETKSGAMFIDAKLAAVKVKITDTLMNRVFGQAVQRVEQKTESRNLHVHTGDAKTVDTLSELDRLIKEKEAVLAEGKRVEKDARKISMSEVRIEEVEGSSDEDGGDLD